MQRVTGIGGFFFRSDTPGELAAWYNEHLGVNPTPQSYDDQPWMQEQGPTVFAPFENNEGTTAFFGGPQQMWMINFRVEDLDAMVAQLRASDIEVTVDPESYPNGRFAQLADPEGNAIQLWEPAGGE